MKAFRTISAVILSLLVLVSSTSFMVGFHFCMGEIEEIALFSKAEGCQKEKSLPPCHRHIKVPCCEDEVVFHEASAFKASIEQVHFETSAPIDIEQPLILISEIIPAAPIARIQYYNYDPPLRPSDLTVKHQVFLI